ncbi:MAG: C25 family cysteine peptidase [Crocinitomicaceae bacterium]
MKFSTRLTSILGSAAFFLYASVGLAQNERGFSMITQTGNNVALAFENPNYITSNVNVNGQQMSVIKTEEGADMLITGVPDLPHYVQSVIIPNQGQTTLDITYSSYVEIPNVEIAPSKGNLYRNVDPATVPYSFGPAYDQDAFYPGTLAELSSPYILRNYRAATVITYPFQYNPVTKVLRVYENLSVNVGTDENESGINELSTTAKETTIFKEIYKHHFLNYTPEVKYSVVEESGSMLIIGPSTFSSQMTEIANWKNQKGIRTEWVDMTTVGGNTDTDVLAFIQDYYANDPDLQFVLLVGDHAEINAHTYGTSGSEQLWSDSYFGQMTGDYYPEIFVGRLSGSTTGEIQTMVDRMLEYEKDPMSGTHYTKALGLGSDQGAGIGDDGEADWQHLRNIRTELMAFGYTSVYEFYDGTHGGADASGDPATADVEAAVNGGISLFQYCGHGGQNVCVSGNYGSPEVDNSTNNGMYPFVISVACNNGTFTSGTCISESWIRASNGTGPTGAIAATGSTILMSWAPPMETEDELTKILTEQYSGNKKTTLGGLFFNGLMSTVENYGSGGNEVMQTWAFFGDPSVVIRTQDPLSMNVTHVASTNVGATGILVNCDVDGVDIAVTQNNEIIGKGVISGGSVNITFYNALTTQDPLLVTGTKYNYRPYQGPVTVNEAIDYTGIEEVDFTSSVSIYPNPAQNNVNIALNLGSDAQVNVLLMDLSGKIVQTVANSQLTAGAKTLELSTANLEAGVYLVSTTINGNTTVEKLTVIK